MARNNRDKNNNPTGRNQYSGGWTDAARERPVAAAAVTAAAVGAGVFLWSRRNQISDQISSLSDQFAEWRESQSSDSFGASGSGDQPFIAGSNSGTRKGQSEIAEEAMTLKGTGRKPKRPADPTVEDQTKAGAIAY